MVLDAPTLTALAGFLTVLGSGIAYLVRRRDKARAAIPRATAEVAQASDHVRGALATVQGSLERELERVRTDADRDRARLVDELEQVRRDRSTDNETAARERRADRDRIAYLEASDKAKGEQLVTLSADVAILRRNEGVLVRWIRTIRAGVAAGTIPPWPVADEPAEVLELDARYVVDDTAYHDGAPSD